MRHQLQLCTRTPTAQWSLMCAGRVVQDRRRQQHRNGPVDRPYLWNEWNTHTVVDASSTQDLTLLFSSSHNVRSLPPRIEPLVLLWISKNPTGGFPETHLAISHDERDLTYLTVPVTSESPEKFFSRVGLVQTDFLGRLLDTTMIDLMCVKQAP